VEGRIDFETRSSPGRRASCAAPSDPCAVARPRPWPASWRSTASGRPGGWTTTRSSARSARSTGEVLAEWEPGLRGREVGALALRAPHARGGDRVPRVHTVPLRPAVGGAAAARAAARGSASSATSRSSSRTTAPTSGRTPASSSSTPGGRPHGGLGRAAGLLQRDGQLWGNPLYRWDRDAGGRLPLVDRALPPHARSGWTSCGSTTSAASSRTGPSPPWRDDGAARALGPGPGAELFDGSSRAELGALPVIAEDLGLITPAGGGAARRAGAPRDAGAAVRLRRRRRTRTSRRTTRAERGGLPRHARQRHPVGWWSTASEAERERAERVLALEPGGVHWRLRRWPSAPGPGSPSSRSRICSGRGARRG
jgi:hypothetical protein